jgi:hypothetical protein
MTPPVLSSPLGSQTNEDWTEEFQFFVVDAAHPDDLTGCLIEGAISLKDKTGTHFLQFSSSSGRITIVTNAVSILVPESLMSPLPPGLYDFDLRVTRPSGLKEILLRGKLNLTAGVTQ